MINTTEKDKEKLKKLCPQGHLIIAISNYRGFRNFLGFLAQYVVNVLQWIVRPFYDNPKKYIAHVFCIYHKNNQLFVCEMDSKAGWRESPIEKSNTFIKITKGQIRIYDLGAIEEKEFENFLKYARVQKYSLLEAIASASFFRFLNIFISYKERFKSNKCHCGSIFLKYQPFDKYLKITGENFYRKYKTHHPEAIDHYLVRNFDLKIVKVKQKKIRWN